MSKRPLITATVAAIFVGFIALAPRVAIADDAGDGYRQTIAIADGIGTGLIIAGVGTFLATRDNDRDTGRVIGAGLGIAGFWTLLLGSPIVHLANGERKDAAFSFGLRTVVPVSSANIGKFICGTRVCSTVGLTVGMIGAIALDYWLLAKPSAAESGTEATLTLGHAWVF